MRRTSFSLSRCFFRILPLPARCTCMLMRPGSRQRPRRSMRAYPAGAVPVGTMSVIVSPSVSTHRPGCTRMSFVPSRRFALSKAYFMLLISFYGPVAPGKMNKNRISHLANMSSRTPPRTHSLLLEEKASPEGDAETHPRLALSPRAPPLLYHFRKSCVFVQRRRSCAAQQSAPGKFPARPPEIVLSYAALSCAAEAASMSSMLTP